MTTAGGKQQLPADGYGTLDAATPYTPLVFAIPAGAKKVSIYAKDVDDPRFSLLRTVVDGGAALTGTTSRPFPPNQWFDIDVGKSGNSDWETARATQIAVCGNTLGGEIHVLALPADV